MAKAKKVGSMRRAAKPQPRRARAPAAEPAAAPEATPPPPAPPAPPQLQLQPAQSLQEIALVLHRITGVMVEAVKVQAAQLEIARAHLKLAEEARDLVQNQKAQGAQLEALLPRVLERLLERAMGPAAAPEVRPVSAAAVASNGGGVAPETGLVCR